MDIRKMWLADTPLRLDPLLRDAGLYSKKETRELVSQGRICVDGEPVLSACMRLSPEAVISVDGDAVSLPAPVYLMLHKPAGLICATTSDLGPTVLELLEGPYRSMPLFPVGRLDKDAEGLLILTSDGALCRRVTRPENRMEKKYFVTYRGTLREDAEALLAAGAVLPEGIQCLPAKLKRLPGDTAEVTVTEGKYHEVKRLISLCGGHVTYLRRLSIGALTLDPALRPGEYREMTAEELKMLFL